jgi:FkbM family methyltransferase
LNHRYRYGRLRLLCNFLRLNLEAVRARYFIQDKRQYHHTHLLGYQIYFHSYPELIDLVEEIFIEQVYNVNVKTASAVIIDCGSNIGISVLYFKIVFPGSTIRAFEPDTLTHDLLKKNIEANNLSGVQVFNCALSDQNGMVNFYDSSESSLTLNRTTRKSNGLRQIGSVNACKLSDFVTKQVDLIKMDIEGSELDVLEDLITSGKINLVVRFLVEFHPRLHEISLNDFRRKLEHKNFGTQTIKKTLRKNPINTLVECSALKFEQ